MTSLTFTHETDASRYTLHRGSDLVSVLDYRDDGRTVAMTRAYTVPTFRGNGYAGEVVDRAVAELEQQENALRAQRSGLDLQTGAIDAIVDQPDALPLAANA